MAGGWISLDVWLSTVSRHGSGQSKRTLSVGIGSVFPAISSGEKKI